MKAPPVLLIVFGVLCGVAARADLNVFKKDGTKAVAKNLRRQGDNIIVTMELPPEKPGDPVKTGDIGIPISQIEKIEFPEPGVLKTARDLIVEGKAADALAQVDQAAKYYEGFRDAPGSWWRQLTLLKMNTLVILGREKEADALADTMSNLATEAESQRTAKVLLAAAATRRGDAQKAADTLDSVLKDSKQSDVLASAAVYKGQSYLALKDWENALLCFLQIPVLYPEAKELAPASMLGVGRAHFGLEDFATARNTFKELMKTFKGTPEAIAAKAELELIAKREKALSEPGAKKDAPPANEPK
jgi:TolA-binding protein